MILLLGDSNLRQTFEIFGDQLKTKLDCEVIFEQTQTNESIKAALEKPREIKPNIIYINSILNEISSKVSRGKAIVDVIKNVTVEQNDIVNKAANEISNSSTLFLICNPMMRYEPKWYEERLSLVHYYINKHNLDYSPGNVSTVAELEINHEHLASDKIHLNEQGRKMFFEKLVADLKIAQEEVKKFEEEGMEWDDLARLSQKTPKTAKKRKMVDQDDEGASQKKKREEDDTILGTLKSFMEEIREDRKLAALKTGKLEQDINSLKEADTQIRQELEQIKASRENDNYFSAAVREDLDVIENENMRNTVIIKKMKKPDDVTIPTDKNELSKKMHEVAKSLVKDTIGDETSVIYTALLFAGKEGVKNTEGKYPPFKIVFKTKGQGIEFREKAVKNSKDEKNKLHKAYIASQQCLATRIRTILLWSMADRIKDQLRGIDSWVNQGLNKPTLQIKGDGKFQKSFTFVQAIQKYGDKVEAKAKEEATKLARRHFIGQVEKIFVIIED
jgi:hypothetical protein